MKATRIALNVCVIAALIVLTQGCAGCALWDNEGQMQQEVGE